MKPPEVPVYSHQAKRTAKWTSTALVFSALVLSTLAATIGHAVGSSTSDALRLPIEPLVTIQDLMRYEVDANSDPIWDSVGSITTREGVVERQPHTDAEWLSVRRHAVVLLEATNLLVIPGRKVSDAAFLSDGPGVLSSSEIQQRIDQHRAQFNAHALALRDIVASELQAIDKRDAKNLQALGEGMDAACESCHIDNWYPHEVVPTLPVNPPNPKGDFKPHAQHD